MTQENNSNEFTEEASFVGPGQILAVARQKLGLSQQDVAERLNFRASLVNDIENDIFDASLPDTFNRGYLKNYAKLVEIKEQEILNSYEALNVANKHNAKMQSFSKETEKQAQNSLIMWISYLILAALLGSSVVWWVQDAQNNSVTEAAPSSEKLMVGNDRPSVKPAGDKVVDEEGSVIKANANNELTTKQITEQDIELAESALPINIESTELEQQGTNALPSSANKDELIAEVMQAKDEQIQPDEDGVTQVQFTFSGDCWVNIYDATGERIAWGIKKGGYVMEISGQAPFKVTLGKPELVSINFDGEAIDMSQFNRGNIAKFTLPLNAVN